MHLCRSPGVISSVAAHVLLSLYCSGDNAMFFFPVSPSVNTAGFSTTDSQFHEQTVCSCVSVDQVVLSFKISEFISNAEITLLRHGSLFFLP